MSPDTRRILAALKRHATAFDMTRDGLGESLCQAATDAIAANFADEKSPDGSAWADLSAEYAAEKAKRYPGKPLGVVLGLLSDPDQMAGDVIVPSADLAMVSYGTTEEARQEATDFQEGDPSRNRPARPFWGLTPESTKAVGDLLDARFRKVIG